MSVQMTSSDLERRDAKRQTSLEDLRKYAPTARPRTTKFAVVTLVRSDVSRWSDTYRLKGAASPKFSGILLLLPYTV